MKAWTTPRVPRMKRCCIVCVWHRPGLRVYRPEARKPPSKKSCCRIFPVLTQAGTDADADLSAFIEPLDTLREIVTDQDMPDEVRAKLCKACAFARRGLSDADSMALSLKLLREAMHLNPNAGVKREIATLSRALKKADSAAAPEDASAQQAQDESSKSKKTTRKPATRKTTATQKAKRG